MPAEHLSEAIQPDDRLTGFKPDQVSGHRLDGIEHCAFKQSLLGDSLLKTELTVLTRPDRRIAQEINVRRRSAVVSV